MIHATDPSITDASSGSEPSSPYSTPLASTGASHPRMLAPGAADKRELDRQLSRRRQWIALSLLLLAGGALYGMVWDIQWHHDVGRDRLFTPPHILLFSGVALSGFLCLIAVLRESWRAYKGDPALNGETSVSILRYFRSSLGLMMAGFGHLLSGASAPLDNYWHYLYGLDVQLWSPFHVMGFIGQSIATLGLICLLASESTRAMLRGELEISSRTTSFIQRLRIGFHPTQLALMLGIAGISTLLLLMTITSATWPDLIVRIGGHPLFLYPLLVGIFLSFGYGLSAAAYSPFSATGITCMLLLYREFMIYTLPTAVEKLRAMESLLYRPDSPFPPLPLYFIPPALIGSGLALDAYRWYCDQRGKLVRFYWVGICATLPVLLLWKPYLTPSGPRSRELLQQLSAQLDMMTFSSIGIGLLLSIPGAHASSKVVEILRRISK